MYKYHPFLAEVLSETLYKKFCTCYSHRMSIWMCCSKLQLVTFYLTNIKVDAMTDLCMYQIKFL